MSTTINPIARRGAVLGILWIAGMLAFAPSELIAQDPAIPAPPVVSRSGIVLLGDLYTQVQSVNPRAAAARAHAEAAQARVPGATRPPDPQVQLGFMNYMLPSLAPMPTLGMRQVQVMQMLPLGGKLAMAGRVAGAQASAASERVREVTWELRSEIAMSFYDL